MSKRKPAPSTLLKLAELRIAELEKELKSTQDQRKMYQESTKKAENEIEGVHAMLDAMPASIPRRVPPDTERWSQAELPLTARLAAFFASRWTQP